MLFHLQTWHWETVGTSLHLCLGPTIGKKSKKKCVSNQSFFVLLTPAAFAHAVSRSHGTQQQQFLSPHPVLPQGIETKKVLCSASQPSRPSWGQADWTFGGLNSTWVGCGKVTQWLTLLVVLPGRRLWFNPGPGFLFFPCSFSLHLRGLCLGCLT